MTDSYYNTTNLEGRELADAINDAVSQEMEILRFFISRGHESAMAPSAVCREVFSDKVPLTSVRRAMTNLTSNGHLQKLESTIVGPYGKPEHLWLVSPRWYPKLPKQKELAL